MFITIDKERYYCSSILSRGSITFVPKDGNSLELWLHHAITKTKKRRMLLTLLKHDNNKTQRVTTVTVQYVMSRKNKGFSYGYEWTIYVNNMEVT